MLAALICPGPSSLGLRTPTADVVIATNRAALYHAAHYWTALDYQTFARDGPHVLGSPLLLTRAAARRKHRGGPGPDLESLADYCPDKLGYGVFSASAGLVLAASLGATTIEVYGADWREGPDADGATPATAVRTTGRFATERLLWARVVAWLAGRGVAVERVGAER